MLGRLDKYRHRSVYLFHTYLFLPLSLQGEQSSLDQSFSSMKDDLSLCDDLLLPSRKIIGDRGGPASMKENICQVSFTGRSRIQSEKGFLHPLYFQKLSEL